LQKTAQTEVSKPSTRNLFRVAAHQNDWHIAADLSQLSNRLVEIVIGRQIEQHTRKMLTVLSGENDCRFAIAGCERRVTHPFQHTRCNGARTFFIIND
jgi:hypothetical protein